MDWNLETFRYLYQGLPKLCLEITVVYCLLGTSLEPLLEVFWSILCMVKGDDLILGDVTALIRSCTIGLIP